VTKSPFPAFLPSCPLVTGYINNITWDAEGCSICNTEQCIDNYCGIHFPATNATNSTAVADCGEQCDIKIYLVWTGTDKNNRTLTSGSMIDPRLLYLRFSTLFSPFFLYCRLCLLLHAVLVDL